MKLIPKIILISTLVSLFVTGMYAYATFDRGNDVEVVEQNVHEVQCFISQDELETFFIVMPEFKRSATMSIAEKQEAYAQSYCELIGK